MEITNLIVARYVNGRVLKGTTQDFSPNRGIFHVHPEGAGDAVELRFKELKAVFFVSSLDGDPARQDIRGFMDGPPETQKGKKICVAFRDGELLCGYTLSWTPDREGFFVFPADTASNNQRVFVISAAAREVKAGPAADILAKKVLDSGKSTGWPGAKGAQAKDAQSADRPDAAKPWTPKLAPRPQVQPPSGFFPPPPPGNDRRTGSD